MISAIEVIVQYFKSASLPANNQVAVKHRYPDPWLPNTAGIVVVPDGGTPNLYLPVQNLRLEIRCYEANSYLALTLLDQVMELARATGREQVIISTGTAMLYNFYQESGPSLLYDEDLNMDFALAFFSAKVNEQLL